MRTFATRPELGPLAELELRTPRLVLRLGTYDEVVELGRIAEDGVHPPDEMPFGVAWTDGIGQPDFLEGFVAYHEGTLAEWDVNDWTLNLLVWADGQLVGTQGVMAREAFAVNATVGTGSWLGQRFQGAGIGTEMRAAVLEFAFTGLDAQLARSNWLVGNHASRRVSEKLGYAVTGQTVHEPRPGEQRLSFDVALAREDWRPPVPVAIGGLDGCRHLFG